MEGEQKKNIQGNIKTLLGRDCKLEKVMMFFKDVEIFEEIRTSELADEINMTLAVSYSHK